jgi:hypothetical protein
VITIPFLVLAGASDPIAPLDDLKGLLRRGAWQRFQSLWGRAPGDCHRVAGALVLDLTAAGRRAGHGAEPTAIGSAITPGWSVVAGVSMPATLPPRRLGAARGHLSRTLRHRGGSGCGPEIGPHTWVRYLTRPLTEVPPILPPCHDSRSRRLWPFDVLYDLDHPTCPPSRRWHRSCSIWSGSASPTASTDANRCRGSGQRPWHQSCWSSRGPAKSSIKPPATMEQSPPGASTPCVLPASHGDRRPAIVMRSDSYSVPVTMIGTTFRSWSVAPGRRVPHPDHLRGCSITGTSAGAERHSRTHTWFRRRRPAALRSLKAPTATSPPAKTHQRPPLADCEDTVRTRRRGGRAGPPI